MGEGEGVGKGVGEGVGEGVLEGEEGSEYICRNSKLIFVYFSGQELLTNPFHCFQKSGMRRMNWKKIILGRIDQ